MMRHARRNDLNSSDHRDLFRAIKKGDRKTAKVIRFGISKPLRTA